MKLIIFGIVLLLFFSSAGAQNVPSNIVDSYHHIIKLMKEDKPVELSRLISYPLKRENPLPDIATPKQFVAYYPTLIDATFKKQLQLFNDTDIVVHHGQYGLVGGPFDGDIWMTEEGKIGAVNYSSKKEQMVKNELTRKIQKATYPTVNAWTENIKVLHSDKLLIRIDDTKQGLRYVSWSHGHSQSDKPDIVIYKGEEEAQGTQGGWTWTFKNGDWTYVVDDVEMAENDAGIGHFLELSYKGILKSTVRLKEEK
jgi:hypothetical protein